MIHTDFMLGNGVIGNKIISRSHYIYPNRNAFILRVVGRIATISFSLREVVDIDIFEDGHYFDLMGENKAGVV